MKFFIPAKTFLLGEYVALAGGPALVLTTTPYFEMTVLDSPGLVGIHPDSPAGRFWSSEAISGKGLSFFDPYQGLGGLGASSAEFIGAYQVVSYLQDKPVVQAELLEAYFKASAKNAGILPSGYDVLAQTHRGSVYINRAKTSYCSYAWPFKDLAFILLHTGKKLSTHKHLESIDFLPQIEVLSSLVEIGVSAFEKADSAQLIHAVNAYHNHLQNLGLVASHSLKLIKLLQNEEGILAVKGCGALGADVLLLLVTASELALKVQKIKQMGINLLATSENLTKLLDI